MQITFVLERPMVLCFAYFWLNNFLTQFSSTKIVCIFHPCLFLPVQGTYAQDTQTWRSSHWIPGILLGSIRGLKATSATAGGGQPFEWPHKGRIQKWVSLLVLKIRCLRLPILMFL